MSDHSLLLTWALPWTFTCAATTHARVLLSFIFRLRRFKEAKYDLPVARVDSVVIGCAKLFQLLYFDQRTL